jgi:hypothetical protein
MKQFIFSFKHDYAAWIFSAFVFYDRTGGPYVEPIWSEPNLSFDGGAYKYQRFRKKLLVVFRVSLWRCICI